MTLFNRRKQHKRRYDPWDLSAPLLYWADGAPWTVGDSCMGTQVFGSTGSGKSSGSMAAMCRAMLRAGYGGLFLTVKPEDRDTYVGYVRDAKRLDDLLVFSPDHGVRYNFIADEQQNSASPVGLAENLTALLMTVSELGDRKRGGGGGGGGGQDNERYFRLEASRLARNGLLALVLSRQTITIPDLHRLIVTAPQSLEQVASASWREDSFCYQCLQAAEQSPKSESLRADFELALTYFLREWPALSPRTRSVVQSTLTSTTDLLSRGAARDMLSSPTPNVSPDMMHDGAIMIADFPVLLYRDVGAMIQVILKFMWQRAHARRDIAKNHRPTFIVADESQMLLVDADQDFQAIARSTRTAVVYATQSVSGMIDALGPNSEAQVHSLLANMQTRLCHQQTDIRTVEYMQQLIGRRRQLLMSGNQPRDANWLAPLIGPEPGGSAGFGEQWEYELQASDLNSLAKGGPPHFVTEAIAYQGGKRLPNGRTWMRVPIRQR
ncbi:MAG: hypothetical protein H6812_10670 [Phycisphaeraceae bacterium]|nr:hypothetical protein [Phycisphaerales bacterium]MCB9843709.1 hypothetical protein [Phycisphaeraceae bacterium]